LEIEKPKPTFIISVLKVDHRVVLASSISNFFRNKISHANKWMRKQIPTCGNSALARQNQTFIILILTSSMKNKTMHLDFKKGKISFIFS
jgi:hypothetical protein